MADVECDIGHLNGTCALIRTADCVLAIKAFDPSIEGETDRFAYRFVKLLTFPGADFHVELPLYARRENIAATLLVAT